MDQAQAPTSPSLACNDFNSTKFIEDTLKQLETRWKNLDHEVEALQDRLKKRERQKKLLSRHARLQNSITIPINRLSLPVLRKIFQFCLPHNRNPLLCNKDAPISLGQVCHSWRQVALTAPELWTAIHIAVTSANWSHSHHNPTPRKPEVLRLQAISSWLSRSGELPLSISIGSWDAVGPPVSTAKFEKIFSSYLECLSLFSRRWQRIFFHLPHLDVINNFFLRYKSTDLPLLEKLHIDGAGCNTGKLTSARALKAIAKEDSFLRCPRLRWLSLPLLGGLLLEAPAQWSQLTVLNLNGASGCPLFQIMGTIASCSNLQSLSVCFDLSPPDVDLSLEQAVTLPHLNSLCVIERFLSFDSPRFFHHLLAPNIRYLAYERYTPVLRRQDQPLDLFSRVSLSTPFLTAFKLFVSRARYAIEEFALSYDWLSEGDLYQFLAILPDIKRLQLQGSGGQANLPRWARPPSDLLLFDDALIGGLLTIPDKRDIVTVITKDVDVPEPDRDQEPSDGAGDTGWGNRSDVRRGFGTTRDFEEDGEIWEETSNFLSPKLEVFQCTGAMFTAEAFLKFLQSRAFPSKRFGISRLRSVDVSFVHWNAEAASGPLDQIKTLAEEVGMSVFFHFPSPTWTGDPPPIPYPAREGLLAVGFASDELLAFRAAF